MASRRVLRRRWHHKEKRMLAPPETQIDLDRAKLSPQKNMVRKFYKEMWDHLDTRLIPEIFHENFTFRGSLGPVLIGHAQFADYVRWVTDTLEDFTSDVLVLIEEDNWVAGKLRFHGRHRKPLFGCAPTGKHVWWNGAAIFTFDGEKVHDLWVLGHIYGLVGRMAAGAVEKAEFAVAF
jgi:predicted ester cyclase